MINQKQWGFYSALIAFLWWGFVPLYFKLVAHVGADEIVAHRILWSVPSLVIIITVLKQWSGFATHFTHYKTLFTLFISALLISTTWLLFAYAIINDQILAASLGYYIYPLMNVLLGFIFLHERFQRLQSIALLLAILGVAGQIILFGKLPWIALGLALCLSLYGLFKKRLQINALHSLLIETIMVAPFACVYLIYLYHSKTIVFLMAGLESNLLLIGLGMVTAVPVVLFIVGAQRLTLSTLGFIQYIAPSITFLLAVFWYDEQFGYEQLFTFALIWLAIILYSLSSVKNKRD